MRSLTRVTMFLFLAALLSAFGCQKVEKTSTQSLDPGDLVYPFIVEAPNRDQTVTVVASATGPVDVYICSEDDQKDADKSGKPPKNSFAKELGVEKETTLKATAPAKKGYAVVLCNAKKPKTSVNLKLTAK